MTGFWPGPGWSPWDALTDAGVRVTDDPRNVAPPCVLMEMDTARPEGTAGGCQVTRGTVTAICIGPGPSHADARKWLWTVPVPILIGFSDPDLGASASDYNDSPAVDVVIPYTHKEA